MISRFFIDRPVFASVLSVLIVLTGVVCLQVLPVARFPEIAPPTVQVSTQYPGADAETVAESVAAPIEQELSGINNLLYFRSQSSNDGSVNITLTFNIGTDLDIAAVETQNRVRRAELRLPQEVIRHGITINKASTNLLMVAGLQSSDPRYDQVYLSNYATLNMLDRLRMVPGVGEARVYGAQDYSMRVWLNPDQLAAKDLTVTEVADAIREQNNVFAAGRIGAEPTDEEVSFTIPVITRGRLQESEEFADIVLRAEPDGSMLRLKDVGRVELGAQSYDQVGSLNGKPATLLLVYLQPGANALRTVDAIKAALDEMSLNFPDGVEVVIPHDTTDFIKVSIQEVVKTLLEAVALVLLVVYLFLGTWRATVVPLLAIPVAIVGTFTGMLLLGFSVNTLTLFGLVLSIGIVVDDAILVVENVERIMQQERLPPREATIKAMGQVTGPIIASVLVLGAVFLPVAFLGGLTGVMYRQFAVTIAISVAISGLVALTLSPALCRLMLKEDERKIAPLRAFDRLFEWLTRGYTRGVRLVLRQAVLGVVIFGVLIAATASLFRQVPGGFIPEEDQGFFLVATALPPGSSLDRTRAAMDKVETFLLEQPEIVNVVSLAGQDFLAGGASASHGGIMFVNLTDWEERQGEDQTVQGLIRRTYWNFAELPEALVLPFNMPAVPGLGTRQGIEFQLQNRGGAPLETFEGVAREFAEAAEADEDLVAVNNSFNLALPQIFVDLDRERAKTLGLDISEVFNTLQAYLGSLYVNDFVKFGRIYRVQLQAEDEYRSQPEDIAKILVRNDTGDMVPLSGVLRSDYRSGPNAVSRFNGYPAVQITAAPAEGDSTGQAMAALSEVARRELPAGYNVEWSGASYQEIKAGNQAPYVMAFGLIVVFLVLAAQYERWSLPLAVMMVVPVGMLGAIAAVYLRGISGDIYFQIGLLTLIGLTSKNAILIVEFCASLRDQGRGLMEATAEASQLRLRPVMMTSMSFILGVLPLVVSEGAGAAGRHSIGTGVMGGMLSGTLLGIFLVPLFYYVVQGVAERIFRRSPSPEAAESPAES